MARRRRRKNGVLGFLKDLNPKTIIAVLIALFGITFYFQWRKGQQEKDEKNNPDNYKEKADALKPSRTPQDLWDRIKSSTMKLAHDLGVNYGWWNPLSWSENDKEVAQNLMYQVQNIDHLEKLYYEVYTDGRNLKNDVLKLLDKKQLEQVRAHYQKFGKTF